MAKSGRKSKVVMRAEFGDSRESQIAALCSAGLSNECIWAAMEVAYPQTISLKDVRRDPHSPGYVKSLPAYDAEDRTKLGWAIRSVKGLMIKDDDELQGVMSELGDSKVVGINSINLVNRPRISTGIKAIDEIYGTTRYVHTENSPDGVHKVGDPMIVDGVQLVEMGLPRRYTSMWGGAPGVGKTRSAIAITKSLNEKGHCVLYVNGEGDAHDFRSWCGKDVNGDLFKILSAPVIRTETIVEEAFKLRPDVIIIDSFQQLAEYDRGLAGQKRSLMRFRVLMASEAAGYPHIIFISQLNKKNDFAGSRKIEHLVDGTLKVCRPTGPMSHRSCFMIESVKMRGAPAPVGFAFKHLDDKVICVSNGITDVPVFDLKQR